MPSWSEHRCAVAATVLMIAITIGCAGTRFAPVDPDRLDEGIAVLERALPGDLAALYDLDVAWSGGLRLAVLSAGDDGRFSVSEPFGSAISITAWSGSGPVWLLDFDAGCRRPTDELDGVAGVGALPVRQAARLLGGRLPAASGDGIRPGPRGTVVVRGSGWAASVVIQPDPWRVVEVRELRPDGRRGWRVRLFDHDGPVPGRLKLAAGRGRRAELDLKRIEWSDELDLPPIPDLPPCAVVR